MKKLLVIIISIITVFSFQGCAGNKNTEPQPTSAISTDRDKYTLFSSKMRAAENTLKFEALLSKEMSLQVSLDISGSIESSIRNLDYNAACKAEVKFDFNDALNSCGMFEGNFTYPSRDSQVTKNAGVYLSNGYFYINNNNIQKTKKSAGPYPPEDYSCINDFINWVLKNTVSVLWDSSIDLNEITPSTLIDIISGGNEKPLPPGLHNIIEIAEALDFKPWDLFDFDLTEKRAKLTLKYGIVKSLAEDALNAYESYMSGNTGTDTETIRAIRQCLPSSLYFEITVDFKYGLISSINAVFNSSLKLPSEFFGSEDNVLTDTDVLFSLGLEIKKLQSDIIFPEDLDTYAEATGD